MRPPPNPSTVPDLTASDDDTLGRAIRGALQLEDAPAAAIKAATSLWQTQHDAQPARATSPADALLGSLHGAIKRIQAVLTFDSWTTSPAALGLRSGAVSRSQRHLMFNAEGHDVDLRIVGTNGSYVLAGQMLGPDDIGPVSITVNTAANDDRCGNDGSHDDRASLRSATLDEFGSFEFAPLERGTYHMTLRTQREVIDLPALEVGDR